MLSKFWRILQLPSHLWDRRIVFFELGFSQIYLNLAKAEKLSFTLPPRKRDFN